MKIQVEELRGELSHHANAWRRICVAAIRPYIYKHLSPSGTFTFSIYQGGEKLGEQSLTSLDIENNSEATSINYFHGPFRILFDSPIIINKGDFEIRLTSSGYTFSDASYLGWIREHDRIVNDFIPTDSTYHNPLAVELWEWRQ